MTPKEKAKELVNKMFNCDKSTPEESMAMLYPHAKQCALIAVDEILKSPLTFDTEQVKYSDGSYAREYYEIPNRYWTQVKKEIELL